MNWHKDRIRQLRVQMGLTQSEFARRLGCRQQTISEWELGLYVPGNAYGRLLSWLESQAASENKAPAQDAPDDSDSNRTKSLTQFHLPVIEVPDVFLD